MSARRVGIAAVLLVAGCSVMSEHGSPDDVHREVAARAGVPDEWETRERGREAIEACVASRLAGEISADDAVAVALLKNPKLRALYRELGVAESDLVAAGLPANPVFSVERRFPGKAAEYDVTEEFLSVLLIPLRRRIAESEFERERLRVTHELIDHTAEVRAAYFRVQAAEQMVEMRRSVVSAVDASLEAARSLRKAGNTTVLSVAEERRSAGRARLELADAELEITLGRERVNVLLGLWGEETRWRIPPHLPELPAEGISPEELERQAVSDRLDLASLRAEIEGLAQSAGLVGFTSLLPELTLGGHAEREPEGTLTGGPSLSFPVPIFNTGQAARARAKYKLLGAEDRYAALAIEIRSEVRSAFARLELARRKAEFYKREVLPVGQSVTDQTQLQYNGMFLGVFQLLQARQAQIDAGRDYIQALAEYWLARTDLDKALGRRLPTGELRPSSAGEVKAQPMMHHHHGG